MENEKHNDLRWIRHFLKTIGADHIRALRKGSEILLQSGAVIDPISHVRFRKNKESLWNMDIARHPGDWDKTPFIGSCEDMMYIIVQNFEWVLAKID
jgi:hypothetical protein